MRMARWKADKNAKVAHYHCLSRVVDRRFILGPDEKEHFIRLMRGYETFCGVKVITFCVLSNHFHILVEVPRRPAPELLPDDKELIRRVRAAKYSYSAGTLEQNLEGFRSEGHHSAAEELRERFFVRMWDVSWFMKMLKQRFTHWYNRRNGRKGTLWEERFRSVLVEGAGPALATMAAYIDLNPVRAGMIDDPKDYRWSGYGEASGAGRVAREGLRVAIQARLGREVVPQRVMAEYRRFLYDSGRHVEPGRNGERGRAGFSPEQIQAVLDQGGQLELADALRCRVRYFCDGAILGSRAFVDEFFQSHRQFFGPTRKDGARKLRGINSPELFVGRALQVRPIG